MGITPTALAAYAAAASAVVGAGSLAYNLTNKPGKPAMTQAAKNPDADVYKNRNAQQALVQGGASTGTGSLLTSSSNVAGNTLLGQ